MFGLALVAFTIVTGLVTLLAAWMTYADFKSGRNISTARTLPATIKRSIRYRVYEKALSRACKMLEASGFRPEFVVAIQYSALGPAAEIARYFRIPVLHVEVTLEDVNGRPVCQSVSANFGMATIRSKRVVIVDNRVYSGRTLSDTVSLIRTSTDQIKTCIVYQPGLDRPNYYQPDIVLFKSKKPIASLLR